MPNPIVRIPTVQGPGAASPRARLPARQNVPGEGDWERITPETRLKVWKKRFGFRSTGTCVCCYQRTIRRDDFACGRRRAYAGGGWSDVSNLEPICARCYEKMGTHDLVLWCKKFQEKLQTVKQVPKTAKKPVRRTTARKPAPRAAAVKKPVRRTAAKKPVRRTAAKKSASRKAKK